MKTPEYVIFVDERPMEILLYGVQRDGIPVAIVKEIDEAEEMIEERRRFWQERAVEGR